MQDQKAGVSVKLPGKPANDTPARPWLRVRRGRFGPMANRMTDDAWFADSD